jgi:hypothetical protein
MLKASYRRCLGPHTLEKGGLPPRPFLYLVSLPLVRHGFPREIERGGPSEREGEREREGGGRPGSSCYTRRERGGVALSERETES